MCPSTTRLVMQKTCPVQDEVGEDKGSKGSKSPKTKTAVQRSADRAKQQAMAFQQKKLFKQNLEQVKGMKECFAVALVLVPKIAKFLAQRHKT